MPGETVALNPNDEASVFSTGSSLTALNGFTGYWHGGDTGSFTDPFLGADSDFIQVSVQPNTSNTFTVLSDLLLVSGWPYGAGGTPTTFAIPEVQFIDLRVWQQVRMSDGTIGYVDAAQGAEVTDDIFSSYASGDLGMTKFQVTFQSEAAHHQDFVGSGTVYRIENGVSDFIHGPIIYDGYDTTGFYFIEVVSVEVNPLYTEAMAGAPIDTNGRYVLMKGEQSGETLGASGFRTYAWGSDWLQTIPFGGSTPLPTDPNDDKIMHIVAGAETTVLTATGKAGNPKGGDASILVKTKDGAPNVGGVIRIDATATGGAGVVQGGSASVEFSPFKYSGNSLSLTGRAVGGDGPTPGAASAEISACLFSMGLSYETSRLTLALSSAGGVGTGGAKGGASVAFFDNSISGWGGLDSVTVRLGITGQTAGKNFSNNSFSLGERNDRLTIVIDGQGSLNFKLNQFLGGSGFDILTIDAEEGIAFSLPASASAGVATAFVTGFEVLRGGRGGDTLTGDTSCRYLQGEGGNDRLSGGTGNDIIDGGAGNDQLNGNAGNNDTVTFEQLALAADGITVTSRATRGVIANLSTGTASGAGSDTLSGFENVRGTGFDDTLTGDNGANVLKGLGGDDTLNGGWGDDILMGGAGDDLLRGGNGSDTADYSRGTQSHLFEPAASPSGGVRVDLGQTGAQDTGNAGMDELVGVENLVGTAFADALIGNAGDNVLTGGAGNDKLNGDLGDDWLIGGSGNDIYTVDSTLDRVIETLTTTSSDANDAGGMDLVRSSATINLSAYNGVMFVENVTLTGTGTINATGNALNNVIVGNGGANQLTGGAGLDRVTGGLGADRFVFRDGDFGGATAAAADIIEDFSQDQGDLIALNQIDANVKNGSATNEVFKFIGVAAFSNVAGQLRFQQSSGFVEVQGDRDGNGSADFSIKLIGSHTLVAGDFVL